LLLRQRQCLRLSPGGCGGGGWPGWCAAAGRQCLGGLASHDVCAIVRLWHRGGALGGGRAVAPQQHHGGEVGGAGWFRCSAMMMRVKTLSS
jgi:hypothetical protein